MSQPHSHAPALEGAGGRRPRWSDAAVETLITLWRAGDLSAADIARRLGVTRNAVLGKIHRLGLSEPRSPGGAPRQARPSWTSRPQSPKRRAPPPARARPPARPAAVDVGPGLVERLEDLPPHACRWPLGEPKSPGFRFCGRPAGERPYCPAHWALAHRPDAARPRRRRRPGRH